jgi:hypothetical protein
MIFKPTLEYRYDGITDSTAETRQQRAGVGLEAELPLTDLTLVGAVRYDNASITGAQSGHLTLFQLGIGTSRYWMKQFFVKGAVNLYGAKWMVGQRFTRVYPGFSVGYLIDGKHLLSLSYDGTVEFNDLGSVFDSNPYLSAGTVYRHTDRRQQAQLMIESDWADEVKTRLSATYANVNDYGLYTNPFSNGMFYLDYRGKTRLLNYQAEGFAKLTPNDYVAVKVLVHSTKNDLFQAAVPYLPQFELGGSLTHWFPFGLGLTPSVSYLHRRETDVVGSRTLPEVFLVGFNAEYDPVSQLRLFVRLHNITDAKYELWEGYQAPPFMITGGLSFRW